MARLPVPDNDAGQWGNILNTFLEVEHNADGTHSIPSLDNKVSKGAQVFDVRDYGAKGDVIRLNNASATSASATVTVTGASFVAGDVGKIAVVYTEDGAGTIRTIASVNSGTQITLSGTAGITASGSTAFIVYGTDDSTAFASAMTAATPDGIDTSIGPNHSIGLGIARVLAPVPDAGGGYMLASQLSVPSGVNLDSPAMLFNVQADRYNPAILLNPYAVCSNITLECMFGTGMQAGTSGAAQAHIYMGNIRLWHVGQSTEGSGLLRSQDGLALLGYHFEVGNLFSKGGVRTVYHNPGTDALINYAYAIGAYTAVEINAGNQIAYPHLFMDTCGPSGGGANGVIIDNAASNISMVIQAFEVTGTTHTLDNVVAIGPTTTNVNKDISLKIQANNTGGNVLSMAYAQESSIDILASNSQFPSGASLPITTGVVYGTGNTGINQVTAMLETSITPYSGTLQGTYQYSRLDATTFANPITVVGEVTATNTPSTDIYNGNAIATGEEILPRLAVNGAQGLNASGSLHLTYFTARKTETINNIQMVTDATAATGTTLARMGIYSVNANTGDLTLVAATANDTTLFSGTFSANQRALTTSFNKVKGTRYAVAVLVVGTGMPSISAIISPAGIDSATPPRLNGLVTGQTDLPANITAGTVTGDYRIFQATITP
ncbi:MAG TPA: hypothetical protein VFI74_05745 [Candidatus Saccharimonadales bacterium]|nr:hypothetical protein [Candidatus Saccharimonadales bacterium]